MLEHDMWKFKLTLDEHYYDDILVLESFVIDPATMRPESYGNTKVPPQFKLQTLREIRFRFDVIVRLSRLVAVEGDGLVPPKGFLAKGPPYYESSYDLFLREVKSLP
jgi:hypothetical protein